MKSILERALVHLLNEENDKAEELLHQFVIETARNIHETLREGDETDLDGELEEGFFGEDDLEDDHGAEHAEGDLGDDLGQDDVPAEADASDLGDDTLDGDMGDMGDDLGGDDMGAEAGEGDIETEIENFEQELADLQSKFDAMLAEIEGEDDVADSDDMAADDDMAAADEDMHAAEDDMADASDELSDDDLVKEDEDFDDITESVVDELQKVAAIDSEGKGATGQDLLGNKSSSKFNKPAAGSSRLSSTARVGHTGFARETAPSSTAQKGGKTVVSTKMKNVRANGDLGTPDTGKGAAIRKPAPDAAHAKGPISGKNVGGKK